MANPEKKHIQAIFDLEVRLSKDELKLDTLNEQRKELKASIEQTSAKLRSMIHKDTPPLFAA